MSAKLIRTKTKGVYKRGGAYCFVFRGPDGKQRRRSAKTYKEAVRRKNATTADVDRGEWLDSRLTFAEYAPDWIATYRGRTKRGKPNAQTIAQYRAELGLDDNGEPILDGDGMATGALAYFARMRLGHVRPPDILGYVAELECRGLAPNTVRLALAPVRALFGTAFDHGLIRSNPAAGVRIVVQQAEDEDEDVKALSEEELAAFLAALPPQWEPFFRFLSETGLRIGEAIELRWADVDGSWMRVKRRFYRGKVGLPKGRKKRSVPLSLALAQELWRRRGAKDELVWTSHAGCRIDQSNLMSRVLKPAARKAGIGDWPGFHAFRHTCATRLFRRGWNAVQVCHFLGHSDPGFTLRTYVHLLPSDLPTPDFAGTGVNNRSTSPAESGRSSEAELGANVLEIPALANVSEATGTDS